MAGIKPSFITGANAKIKAGDKTLAYAQDVSYTVTVSTIPIETMGRYEAVNHEPVAYFVEGSLSVVRYTKDAASQTTTGTGSNATTANSQIASAAANGNSVDKWAGAMFNPGSLLTSTTIDIEIFAKNSTSVVAAGGTAPANADGSTSIGKLRDCRLTSKGGAIDKRGILVERYSFNAILMDDDGGAVSGSGDRDLT
jgi:hypothetical protein